MSPRVLSLLLPVLLCVACIDRAPTSDDPTKMDPGDPNQPPKTNLTLFVTPADAVLEGDAKKSVTQDYKVANKNGDDVTSQAALTVDDSQLGSFKGNRFGA